MLCDLSFKSVDIVFCDFQMLNCHCNKASTSTSGIAKKMKPYLKRSPNKVP